MALPISGTYNFQSISIEEMLIEAYELVGYSRQLIEPQKLYSALRSLNLTLIRWMNRGVNLWTLNVGYLNLNVNQPSYVMPNYVSDFIQINTRQFNREYQNGTAATNAGGVAANAFDGNPATSCVNNARDGIISYDYKLPPLGTAASQMTITFVGITSQVTQTCSIDIRARVDDGDPIVVLYTIPPQVYTAGVTLWFDIPTPIAAYYYDIKETGGATLDINEIYFNDNVIDIAVSLVSRDDYISYPTKYIQNRPSSYYLDRRYNAPVLYLYPVPTADYQVIQYSYKKMMTDAVTFTDSIEIPSRFYPAVIAEIANTIAIKAEALGITVQPDKAMRLQQLAQETFAEASIEDSESTPMGFQLDLSKYA